MEQKLYTILSWINNYDVTAFTGEISIDLTAGTREVAARSYERLRRDDLDFRVEYTFVDDWTITLTGVIFEWETGAQRYAARSEQKIFEDIAQRTSILDNPRFFSESAALQSPNLTDDQFEAWAIEQGVKGNDDIPQLIDRVGFFRIDEGYWLLAIGIETYQYIDNIIHSRRTSEMFVETARKILGIERHRIYTLYDEEANRETIQEIIRTMLFRMQEEKERHPERRIRLMFYYSGHGVAPADDGNEPYIVPHDGIPDFSAGDSFFRVRDLFAGLLDSPVESIVAFMDTDFGGQTEGVSIFKGRAIDPTYRFRPIDLDRNRISLIIAADQGQSSNVLPERGHRLFSYYTMRSLLTGTRTVNELYDEVRGAVERRSRSIYGESRLQSPILIGSRLSSF